MQYTDIFYTLPNVVQLNNVYIKGNENKYSESRLLSIMCKKWTKNTLHSNIVTTLQSENKVQFTQLKISQ